MPSQREGMPTKDPCTSTRSQARATGKKRVVKIESRWDRPSS